MHVPLLGTEESSRSYRSGAYLAHGRRTAMLTEYICFYLKFWE